MPNSYSHDLIVSDLENLMKGFQLENTELYNGAYFLLEDKGKIYDKWKQLPEAVQTVSSHQSNKVPQFSVRGSKLHVCLFSTRVINGEKHTWFQLERYPVSPKYFFPHMVCFFHYERTGQNCGPLGYSNHTEHHQPIYISANRASVIATQQGSDFPVNHLQAFLTHKPFKP